MYGGTEKKIEYLYMYDLQAHIQMYTNTNTHARTHDHIAQSHVRTRRQPDNKCSYRLVGVS